MPAAVGSAGRAAASPRGAALATLPLESVPEEAQPWPRALCSVTERTWEHDALDMPGVITMEPLLAAFHFLHFVEANAFTLLNEHIYRQEKIQSSLRKAAFFLGICCFAIRLQAATVFN